MARRLSHRCIEVYNEPLNGPLRMCGGRIVARTYLYFDDTQVESRERRSSLGGWCVKCDAGWPQQRFVYGGR